MDFNNFAENLIDVQAAPPTLQPFYRRGKRYYPKEFPPISPRVILARHTTGCCTLTGKPNWHRQPPHRLPPQSHWKVGGLQLAKNIVVADPNKRDILFCKDVNNGTTFRYTSNQRAVETGSRNFVKRGRVSSATMASRKSKATFPPTGR
ncbi:hypothetical protein DFS34DRAFT_155347 [Phlyctochytrium arcticum]|nr:hypothetical protein DFS34DRAFT_155347 [Phlyctochytrium arcticum]